MKLGIVTMLLLVGCHAAAPPVPPTPTSPCAAACVTLRALGCPEGIPDDCVTILAREDGQRGIRTPSGAPLTCEAVAGVRTAAEARALGVPCAAAATAPPTAAPAHRSETAR